VEFGICWPIWLSSSVQPQETEEISQHTTGGSWPNQFKEKNYIKIRLKINILYIFQICEISDPFVK
jgi:hypothetical protein